MLPDDRPRDPATGRPIETIGALTNQELAEELLVAAMAHSRYRIERFNELLAERDRRSAELIVA